METLVMLVRDTPLPSEVDLQKLLAELPPQMAQNPRAAVWFENGEVVQKDTVRNLNFFNPQRIGDPILATQRLLKDKLQPHFDYTRAVSFANEGK